MRTFVLIASPHPHETSFIRDLYYPEVDIYNVSLQFVAILYCGINCLLSVNVILPFIYLFIFFLFIYLYIYSFSGDEASCSPNHDEESSFSPEVETGDLVWGQIRGYSSWPGKVVSDTDVKGQKKKEEGKVNI